MYLRTFFLYNEVHGCVFKIGRIVFMKSQKDKNKYSNFKSKLLLPKNKFVRILYISFLVVCWPLGMVYLTNFFLRLIGLQKMPDISGIKANSPDCYVGSPIWNLHHLVR